MPFQKLDDLDVPKNIYECKICGFLVMKGDNFCSKCGRRLEFPKEENKDWIVKV